MGRTHRIGTLLLAGAMTTVAVGFTTVKMLPHDNKSELQIVIDAPEGFTLEQTNAAAREIATVFRTLPEKRLVRIAYPEDCQTCFACELDCPEGAIYVGPMRKPRVQAW